MALNYSLISAELTFLAVWGAFLIYILQKKDKKQEEDDRYLSNLMALDFELKTNFEIINKISRDKEILANNFSFNFFPIPNLTERVKDSSIKDLILRTLVLQVYYDLEQMNSALNKTTSIFLTNPNKKDLLVRKSFIKNLIEKVLTKQVIERILQLRNQIALHLFNNFSKNKIREYQAKFSQVNVQVTQKLSGERIIDLIKH